MLVFRTATLSREKYESKSYLDGEALEQDFFLIFGDTEG
jgi:hypothetical protein